jgi:hypothetical protein
MGINESGEFIRDSEGPDISGNPEREELIRQSRELTARQDQEPDAVEETNPEIWAKKKAEIKKRLLGE